MGLRLTAAVTASVFALSAACASAAPAPAPAPAAPPAPFAIPNPNYDTLELEVDVARPAAQVWARVGKYCDIAEWLRTTCQITSTGSPERLGAVRVLGLGVTEMLVAKTPLSYTYTQPVRVGVPYNAYHGTLEVRPVTATTSKLIYSMFWDRSMLADDAAATTAKEGRRARFGEALRLMKILAEGGTLPPAAPAR
jgi:hypothetical protein